MSNVYPWLRPGNQTKIFTHKVVTVRHGGKRKTVLNGNFRRVMTITKSGSKNIGLLFCFFKYNMESFCLSFWLACPFSAEGRINSALVKEGPGSTALSFRPCRRNLFLLSFPRRRKSNPFW